MVLKTQLTLNQKAWVPHYKLSLSYNCFVVNDGNKLDHVMPQTMCCMICHFVSQNYNFKNTIKKKKGMILYNS